MKKIKFRSRKLGGHIHVNVFLALEDQQYVNCGKLCFLPEEWETFKSCVTSSLPDVVIYYEEEKLT